MRGESKIGEEGLAQGRGRDGVAGEGEREWEGQRGGKRCARGGGIWVLIWRLWTAQLGLSISEAEDEARSVPGESERESAREAFSPRRRRLTSASFLLFSKRALSSSSSGTVLASSPRMTPPNGSRSSSSTSSSTSRNCCCCWNVACLLLFDLELLLLGVLAEEAEAIPPMDSRTRGVPPAVAAAERCDRFLSCGC